MIKLESTEALNERAAALAKLMAECHPDQRGDVLKLAGQKLKDRSQGFTGKLLVDAGLLYGVSS